MPPFGSTRDTHDHQVTCWMSRWQSTLCSSDKNRSPSTFLCGMISIPIYCVIWSEAIHNNHNNDDECRPPCPEIRKKSDAAGSPTLWINTSKQMEGLTACARVTTSTSRASASYGVAW